MLLSILSIITLVVAVYYQTVNFGVIIDDERFYAAIKKGSFGRFKFSLRYFIDRLYGGGTFASGKNCPKCGGMWLNCPLCQKTDGIIWSISPKIDHAFTVLLHAITCVLIYLAFGRLGALANIPNAYQISLSAALLYALNPANNQTAIWLNGRRYQINIIIVLLMMLIGPIGLVLYPLTALFQVSAFFSPLVFGPIAGLLIPIGYFIGRKNIHGRIKRRSESITNEDVLKYSPKRLILTVKIYGAYFFKMIFPGRTLISYPNFYYFGNTKEGDKNAYAINAEFWLGVGAMSTTAVGLVLLPGDLRWWLAFMALATLQWCGIIAVTQLYADRYVSLPNVFMMFFVSYLAFTYLGAYVGAVLASLLIYYFVNLQITMRMYRSIQDCWDYNIYFHPSGVRIREYKAARLLTENDPMGAWEVIKGGLMRTPHDMKMNMLAAHCSIMLGDKQMALAYLREAKKFCYTGQEKMLRGFQRMFFGCDIEDEVKKIQNKESTLDRKRREEILKINEILNSR